MVLVLMTVANNMAARMVSLYFTSCSFRESDQSVLRRAGAPSATAARLGRLVLTPQPDMSYRGNRTQRASLLPRFSTVG